MDTPRSTYRSTYVAALVAAILAGLASTTTLNGGFVIDDRSYVVENKSVLGERGIFSEPTPPTLLDPEGKEVSGRWLGLYRPLTVATWRLNRVLSGADPFAYHLTNVVLHGLVTFLVAILAWSWSRRLGVVWWTGILFAVHPIHVEAVAWISGRAELLSAAFSLGCIIAYGRPGDRRSWLRVSFAALLYLAAALSKETALPLPALLVLLDRLRGAAWLPVARRIAPATIAMAVVVLVRISILGSFGPDVAGDPVLGALTLGDRAALGLSVIGVAARKLVFPFDLAFHYPPAPFFESASTWVGVAVLLLFAAGLLRARSRLADAIPGFLLLMVASLPFLHVIPIGAVFADQFWYLASAGFLYLVAISIHALNGPARRIASGAAACAVVAFLTITLVRNPAFAEERTLWEEVLDRSPDCGLAAFEIGRALEARGLLEYQSEERKGALFYFRHSLSIEPSHLFAGLAHLKLGDHAASKLMDGPAAEEHYRAILELDPLSVDGRIRLAMLLPSGLVRQEDALRLIDEALRLLPAQDKRREAALDLRSQIEQSGAPPRGGEPGAGH